MSSIKIISNAANLSARRVQAPPAQPPVQKAGGPGPDDLTRKFDATPSSIVKLGEPAPAAKETFAEAVSRLEREAYELQASGASGQDYEEATNRVSDQLFAAYAAQNQALESARSQSSVNAGRPKEVSARIGIVDADLFSQARAAASSNVLDQIRNSVTVKPNQSAESIVSLFK
jgi:hypothetical protein